MPRFDVGGTTACLAGQSHRVTDNLGHPSDERPHLDVVIGQRTVVRDLVVDADVQHIALNQNSRAHLWRKIAYLATHRPAPGLLLERIATDANGGAAQLADQIDRLR